jgi:hypothetical protein
MSQQKRSNPDLKRNVRSVETIQTVKVNFWGMVQNVATHAMNKGQFLAAAAAAIILTLIWKIPEAVAGDILKSVLRNLGRMKGLSYLMNVVFLLGWAAHMRWVTRSNSRELDRIGREKTQLQEQVTNLKLANPVQKGPRNEH